MWLDHAAHFFGLGTIRYSDAAFAGTCDTVRHWVELIEFECRGGRPQSKMANATGTVYEFGSFRLDTAKRLLTEMANILRYRRKPSTFSSSW